MREGQTGSNDKLREWIEASHESLMERCMGSEKGSSPDADLGSHYASLIDELSQLPREELLALKVLSASSQKSAAPNGTQIPVQPNGKANELVMFRRLADTAGYGFAVSDLRGNLTYANPALCTLLGVEHPKDVFGHSMTAYYPPELQDRLHGNITPIVQQKGQWSGELLLQSQTGNLIPTIQNIFIVHGTAESPSFLAYLILDITDRKRADEALQASEENFRALAENANDGIVIAVGDGSHVFANARAAEMTGYSISELLNLSFRKLAHPDELKMLSERYQRRMKGLSAPHHYETLIVAKGGRHVPVELTAAKTRWHDQDADIVVIRDITNRRLAEHALRESQEKYRTLVEEVGQIIYSTDQDGVITYVSPGVEQILGYTPSEVMGRSVMDFVSADDAQSTKERLEAVLSGDTRVDNEQYVHTKSGELRWVRATRRPIMVGDRPMGVRGVIVDITDRKLAEQALAESESKYAMLVEKAMDGVVIVQNEHYKFANQAIISATGYAHDELVGMHFLDLLAPESRPLVAERYRRRQAGEEVPSLYNLKVLCKDGSKLDLEMNASVIQYQGQLATMGVARNITDRVRAERALEVSEERWRSLVDNTPGRVLIIDRKGIVQFVNRVPGAAPPEEVIGRCGFDYLVPDHQPAARRIVESVFSQGEAKEIEVPTVGPSGTTRYFLCRISPVKSGERIESAVVLTLETTDRKQREAALDEVEDKYKILVEHARDGVVIVQDEVLRFANQAMLDISGFSPTEVVGMSFLEPIAPESRESVRVAIEMLSAGQEKPKPFKAKLICKDGSKKVLEIVANSIRYEGRPAVMSINRDVTERQSG